MALSNNYQVCETEAKALIKGALLFYHGAGAAFNSEVLAAAWDCYNNAIANNKSLETAIKECVLNVNVDMFASTGN